MGNYSREASSGNPVSMIQAKFILSQCYMCYGCSRLEDPYFPGARSCGNFRDACTDKIGKQMSLFEARKDDNEFEEISYRNCNCM